jgi:UDP-N-acetylglucosamine transferase subunit ALG13
MIFVTVGTSTFPFDRLLRGVDSLEVGHELVVQYGASGLVPRARVARQFMSYAEVVEHMQRARAVIAHGGAGSILTALQAGRHPLIVPRRRQHSEAVDDHQVELASRLADRGLLTIVDDVSELPALLDVLPAPPDSVPARSELAFAVSDYVASVLGPLA